MNLTVGIVGLPNVGKSTLFNALLKKQQAMVANYPFATIDPNVGVVAVPDPRLSILAGITARELSVKVGPLSRSDLDKMPPIKPATVEFVDIAGLVKGAAEGAGLGNKFLSHIREVNVICHVIRAFEDLDVVREGSVDPQNDYKTVQTELILADLQTLESSKRKSQSAKPQLKNRNFFNEVVEKLNSGIPMRDILLQEEERDAISKFFLLTAKPELIVLNVAEQDYTEEKILHTIEQYKKLLSSVIASEARYRLAPGEVKQSQEKEIATSPSAPRNDNMVVICARIESELASLSEDEQKAYLKELGLQESGLERLIKKAYEQLGLISFLTAGEKEVRAWTIKKGSNAVEAAGEIHTDFMKKFIKAEVVSFDDYISIGGRKKAREVGKARLEGKDYIVQDGDVIEFKIGS